MAREMVEPTGALEGMIERGVKPIVAQLRAIVVQLVDADCPKLTIERGMLSVIGQCVFYVHSRPVLERVFPKHVQQPDIDAVARHIATFSLAGLRAACSASSDAAKKGRR